MKTLLTIISFAFVALLGSCKSDQSIDPDNPILGIWVYKNSEKISNTEYASVYERKDKFENNLGIAFKTSNKLIERKNSGWCGTPPISYGDYDGAWYLNDKKITTKFKDWNGITFVTYEIISIDDKILKIKRLQ
jgi:hypothetical protein